MCALFSFVVVFNACSTDVDLYAEYKDITVVYGLLDSGVDTNFVKINKAFLGPGNALQFAQIADSNNYPFKLNAKLVEYRASVNGTNYQQTDEFFLDTITIHDKEPGVFYAPDQLVYYTTHRIRPQNNQYKYRYQLQIDRGDTIITSTTDIVGGGSFNLLQAALNFSSTAGNGTLSWMECPNAAIYEAVIKFHFIEVSEDHDSTLRVMTWALGSHPEHELTNDNGVYSIPFKASLFFYNIASFLGADTLKNVQRLIYEPSLDVSISAGGDELYNFITVNGPSNSIVQSLPEYTNVSGGYGVLSSRTKVSKAMKLASQTIPELEAHENWHFKQIK